MTNTEIKNNYNVVKIVSSKELLTLSRTYKDNLDTIIVMMERKTKQSKIPKYFTEFVNKQEAFNTQIIKQLNTVPQYFTEFVEQNNKVLQQIIDRLIKVEDLLYKVIKLNNLKTK